MVGGDSIHLAGGKTQTEGAAEADSLGHRILPRPAEGQLVQAHELKELVTRGSLPGVGDQASVELPLRGAHRISSSPVRPDTSTSCVKLLRPA